MAKTPPRKATSPLPLWRVMTPSGFVAAEIYAKDSDAAVEQAQDVLGYQIVDVMDDVLVIEDDDILVIED